MAVQADELVMPSPEATSAVDTTPAPWAAAPEAVSAVVDTPAPAIVLTMPEKGQKMEAVLKKFGEPKKRHKPAGGDTPNHPAITRWDYESFSVFFERGKVIDSVNHGKPAEIHHADELKPLEY